MKFIYRQMPDGKIYDIQSFDRYKNKTEEEILQEIEKTNSRMHSEDQMKYQVAEFDGLAGEMISFTLGADRYKTEKTYNDIHNDIEYFQQNLEKLQESLEDMSNDVNNFLYEIAEKVGELEEKLK